MRTAKKIDALTAPALPRAKAAVGMLQGFWLIDQISAAG